MFKYTTLYINSISFFISVIIFFSINFFISNFDAIIHNSNFKVGFEVIEENQNTSNEILNSEQNFNNHKEEYSSDFSNKNNAKVLPENESEIWCLEIPVINLKAEIQEGTSKEIMEDYIGHFEETSKFNGNIGLAAHNRGYKNNYFKDIKKLEEGDKIYYFYKNNINQYEVEKNFIIEDTDWSILDIREENIITLITCVENEPNYRRCIQAKEVINE